MTTLAGTVQSAPAGAKGFDTDVPLSADAAAAFHARGYRFCLRYVGRLEMGPADLTTAEAQAILGAGLALMVVQHVRSDVSWMPSGPLGATYGANAAAFTKAIGIPPGVQVWLDLEGVSEAAAADDVAAYCESWYDAVQGAGYVPGIYVGWHPGLSGQALYGLKFQHYWGAYNVDVAIPQRGWCLKQSPGTGGTIAGVHTSDYDDDVTLTDAKGGQAQWLAAAG